jgi:hypothetical protein
MKAYVGQTRSQTLIAELGAAGIGECTARGELPPRRRPWFYDNGAFRDWTAGKPFDRARFEVDLARIRAEALAPDFVVVPDLVAKGRASLDESLAWLEPLADVAPLYLAVQDGMAERDVAPHVARFAGIFVGGSLRWKMATGGGVGRLRAHERPAVSCRARRDGGPCGLGAGDRGRLHRLVAPALVPRADGAVLGRVAPAALGTLRPEEIVRVRGSGHAVECRCVRCRPELWRSQPKPLGICPRHGEKKIRRPGGTVQCRSCVRESKAARRRRGAKWLRYQSQESEVYRRAAIVRAARRAP